MDHPFNIDIKASVTFNANGRQIVGCKETRSHNTILIGGGARLTINNARITRLRVRNYGGVVTVRDSVFSNIEGVALVNYGWAFVHNTIFDGNTGDSDSNVYWAHGHFGRGRALFQDNLFRNNGPVEVEALSSGPSTRIYLCGENILEGLPEDDNAEALAMFIAENGGSVSFSCPEPPPRPTHQPPSGCLTWHQTGRDKQPLGAIGPIL